MIASIGSSKKWTVGMLLLTLVLVCRGLPSQRHIDSNLNEGDPASMSTPSHGDVQRMGEQEYFYHAKGDVRDEAFDCSTFASAEWVALPFNIYYPHLNKFHSHDKIDFARDALLDPAQHGPEMYTIRQQDMMEALQAGRYGLDDYSYQLDLENEKALHQSMKSVSIDDGVNGAVFVPSHNLMYCHRDMTKREAKQRWQNKQYIILNHDPRSDHYYVTVPSSSSVNAHSGALMF